MYRAASGVPGEEERGGWLGSPVQLTSTGLAAWYRPGRGPTIVLEAGLGLPGAFWQSVCDRLPADRAVVRYDRAGLGDSSPGPGPRTASRQARELAELLDHLAPPRPYLLVGHSAGAFVVRVFAAEHAREVAAIVLVDPSTEDQRTRPAVDLVANLLLRALARLARIPGLQRVVRAAVHVVAPRARARTARRLRLLPLLFRPGHLEGTRLENQAFEESMAQVRHGTSDQVRPEPSVRVVTVVAAPSRSWPAARLWQSRQRGRVGGTELRSDPSRVLAEGSGHLVPLDDPDLVVSVIDRAAPAAP